LCGAGWGTAPAVLPCLGAYGHVRYGERARGGEHRPIGRSIQLQIRRGADDLGMCFANLVPDEVPSLSLSAPENETTTTSTHPPPPLPFAVCRLHLRPSPLFHPTPLAEPGSPGVSRRRRDKHPPPAPRSSCPFLPSGAVTASCGADQAAVCGRVCWSVRRWHTLTLGRHRGSRPPIRPAHCRESARWHPSTPRNAELGTCGPQDNVCSRPPPWTTRIIFWRTVR